MKEKPARAKYNTLEMKNLAIAADRTSTSDRSAAILTNAVLQDIGILTPDTSDGIIDRNEIVRQRKRVREEH